MLDLVWPKTELFGRINGTPLLQFSRATMGNLWLTTGSSLYVLPKYMSIPKYVVWSNQSNQTNSINIKMTTHGFSPRTIQVGWCHLPNRVNYFRHLSFWMACIVSVVVIGGTLMNIDKKAGLHMFQHLFKKFHCLVIKFHIFHDHLL